MAADEPVTAREVVVDGRVQGVFYRNSCMEEARRHGVAGWVTNEPDGTVRAWFEGPAPAVRHMVAWAHSGPPYARVRQVNAREVEPAGLTGFEVR